MTKSKKTKELIGRKPGHDAAGRRLPINPSSGETLCPDTPPGIISGNIIACEQWKRVLDRVNRHSGWIEATDEVAFLSYCISYAIYVDEFKKYSMGEKNTMSKALSDLIKTEDSCGLSPKSRMKIDMGPAEKDELSKIEIMKMKHKIC